MSASKEDRETCLCGALMDRVGQTHTWTCPSCYAVLVAPVAKGEVLLKLDGKVVAKGRLS